ncbi:TPA: hypothetical protein ACX6PW_003768 [Photobacterium damselae]
MNILIAITIFFLPFSNLLALGTYFNISFLFGCFSFFYIYKYLKIDIFVLILLFLMIFVLIGDVNSSVFLSFNNIAYVDIVTLRLVLLYLFFIFIVYQYMLVKPELVFKVFLYSFYFTCAYGLIDFILINFFDFRFDNYIYRFSVQENNGTISNIIRNRSLFSEPGHFAFYLNVSMFFLLSISKYFDKRNVKFIIVAYLCSILTTFSAAGIVFFLLSLMLYCLYTKRLLLLIFFMLVSLLFFYVFKDSIYVDLLFSKITLSDHDMSAQDRLNKASYIKDLILDGVFLSANTFIFGFGSGSVKHYLGFSLLNTYAIFFVEHGFFIFVVLFCFMKKIYGMISTDLFLCLSIFIYLCHLFVIPDFYYLFTVPVLVYFFCYEKINIIINEARF